jgi:hypothetical protein
MGKIKLLLLIISSLIFQNFVCQKAKTFKIKKFEIANLSDTLKENSGLNFFQNQLLTFNDGGNSSELFQINSQTGKIQHTFKTNLQNTDWEAITNDGNNFYIGDFGNNAGTRKDLKIYKIPFDSVNSVVRASSSNNAFASQISFYYPEQKDFTPKNLKNDFDAEAMVFLNGKIHLFTKEWKAKSTTHYTINPENFELQKAQKIETFKTGYVVTDASIFENKLYLVGYTKKTKVYLQIFEISENTLFFNKPSSKYYLGSAFSLSQIEGIAVNSDGICISGEKFVSPIGKVAQKLFFIPHEKFNNKYK